MNASPTGLFITDLDGTLLRSDRTLAQLDREALVKLGAAGVTRVIATGRTRYAFDRVVDDSFPIDYVIFSTGAGIMTYPAREIIHQNALTPQEVSRIYDVLLNAAVDFMLYRPIPDNHYFTYHRTTDHPDVSRILDLYRPYARPFGPQAPATFESATQFLAVVPAASALRRLEKIRRARPDFSVVRATSPLDRRSIWIEIFPATVSKASGAAWLAARLGVRVADTLAVGNDYNDLDLLHWSAEGYVVANAPEDLKARFTAVESNDRGGVSQAIERWRVGARSPVGGASQTDANVT